jgi:hypothetical protein
MGATNPNAGVAPGAGGKGGMGGNAQNNPQAVGQTMNPYMSRFANYGTMLGGLGAPGASAFNLPPNFNVSGPQQMPAPSMPTADPRPMNWTPSSQPYQPSTGWTGNQPSQWAAQAEAIKPPAYNKAGLPTGGILAKLYGG